MKKAIVALTMVILSGCAGLTIGKYPYPSDVNAAPEDTSMAKIDTDQFVAFQRIEGYTPDFGLVGIVVPFIPIGQWKWLTGIGKDDLRININLWVTPKAELAEFYPGTLRIKVDSQEHQPTEIKAGSGLCNSKDALTVDPSKALPIRVKMCIWFNFSNLHPPEGPFSVIVAGLPTVQYSLEQKVRFGFLSQ